ncbi:MAG: Organic solvent tolerance protein OstA [Cyclobacteriaceae bacterium]|nr:Organic solvent tolerance protein OstA [Cyclobacteriaceae bacterium]UYN88080.1 MAG: Organic solvent tolerance protein OstA [Cyclobacteriaceae bacterium]
MRYSLLLLILVSCHWVLAQNRVTLKQADQLIGGVKDGERFDRVIGNVIFEQSRTTIHCDSALFFRTRNIVEAFGRVKIIEGDSVTITSNRAEYDGNTRIAKLRSNVVFTKLATATLYTDYLDFDRLKNEAYYFNKGRLVDSINVLTSNKGYYQVNSNIASFKRNVVVTNPDYNMKSDSLQYNSRTKIIYFRTETTVTDKEGNTFVYEGGEYDTRSQQSDIKQGQAESQSYTLTGNKLKLDDLRKFYTVKGNVVMTHKEENLVIYGDDAWLDKRKNIAKVFTNAWLTKVTEEGDTLFMSADTLVSIDSDDPAKKRLLAYNNVKIFKKDIQGLADSLEYRQSDSIMFLYKAPALWTAGNQMTADTISMLIENNTISKIFLTVNAFVISTDTLKNFNQIKGRKMTAYFKKNQLHRVVVEGNGESIYFALEDKTNLLMGMNKIICSNITIRFKDARVNNLSFYVRPDADFIPPHELKKDDLLLNGFQWKIEMRPTRKEVVKKTNSPQMPAAERARL